MCHTFTLLDAGYFCIVYLWAFFCDAIKLFGNTLVHSGFALLGRTRTVLSLIGISFSATEARPFCILYSMSHESWRFLVWLVEVAGKPYEHRAALIFSGHSFLTCEQFPPHMLWSYLEEYCRGRLWEFPEFSLCADLSLLVLHPVAVVATLVSLDTLHYLLNSVYQPLLGDLLLALRPANSLQAVS